MTKTNTLINCHVLNIIVEIAVNDYFICSMEFRIWFI